MKILITRLGKIGDTLLLAPPLLTIKRHVCDAEFFFLTDSKYADVGMILNGDNNVIHFKSQEYSAYRDNFHFNSATVYDIAFDFQATPESVEIFHRISAKRKIGFETENTLNHSYTDAILPDAGHSMSHNYYKLFKHAWPEVPPHHDRITRLRDGKVKSIGLAPGGSVPCKRWAVDKWEGLSQQLQMFFSDSEFHLISEEKSPNLFKIRCHQWHFGKSLFEIQRLLKEIDLLIANDSGLMHLAAISGCPVIGLFGSSNKHIWSSYSDIIYPIKNEHNCNKSEKTDCENLCKMPDCLETINVDQVVIAVKHAIERIEA